MNIVQTIANELNIKTHTNWARRIIGQANVYGVRE